MGRKYEAAKILCPYYVGETPGMICCHLPYPMGTVNKTFGNRAEKKDYRKNFCCTTDYGECFIAKWAK